MKMAYESHKPFPASPRELIVIARPEAQLRVTDKGVVSLTNFDVKCLNDLLRKSDRTLHPLFHHSKKLPKCRDDYRRIKDDVAPPDLSVYFRLYAPDRELESLARQLYGEPAIEAAYVKPGAVPPVWNTGVIEEDGHPKLFSNALASLDVSELPQSYLDDPPAGIGARSVWGMYTGADGTGVKIIDIEGGWRFTHEDLRVNQGGLVAGTQNNDPEWTRHGTAVLGIIGGDKDDRGITGICPGAFVQAVSNTDSTIAWGTAAAIQRAAELLDPGDIILIELQQPGPVAEFVPNDGQVGYIPVEWWDDNLAAIQYATSKGVIVVEAGGNGRDNLDDDIYDNPPELQTPFRDLWRNPFRRDPVDSGAIIVGAGAPPEGTHGITTERDRSRLEEFSNYGTMFDAQGWGEQVETCGGAGEVHLGADDDEDLQYTNRFSGTSSATAMVAGALGCIQGARKGAGLPPLTPSEARDLLRCSWLGELQQSGDRSPVRRRIGSRPNLIKMVTAVVA
jgi:subtilisin family serine protease